MISIQQNNSLTQFSNNQTFVRTQPLPDFPQGEIKRDHQRNIGEFNRQISIAFPNENTEALQRLFKDAIKMECFENKISVYAEESIQGALNKRNPFIRLFESETWEEWAETRTPLGKVVTQLENWANAKNHPKAQIGVLSLDTIRNANAIAQKLLTSRNESLEDNCFKSLGLGVVSSVVTHNALPLVGSMYTCLSGVSARSTDLTSSVSKLEAEAHVLLSEANEIFPNFKKLQIYTFEMSIDPRFISWREKAQKLVDDPQFDGMTLSNQWLILKALGDVYGISRRYEKSINTLLEARRVHDSMSESQDEDLIHVFSGIGENYYRTYKYDESISYYEKALDTTKRNYGENSGENIPYLKRLGDNYYYKASYNEAIGLYDQSLSLAMKEKNPISHHVVDALVGLGYCFFEKDDHEHYSEMIEMIEQILNAWKFIEKLSTEEQNSKNSVGILKSRFALRKAYDKISTKYSKKAELGKKEDL